MDQLIPSRHMATQNCLVAKYVNETHAYLRYASSCCEEWAWEGSPSHGVENSENDRLSALQTESRLSSFEAIWA